jgi:hypothetical protein
MRKEEKERLENKLLQERSSDDIETEKTKKVELKDINIETEKMGEEEYSQIVDRIESGEEVDSVLSSMGIYDTENLKLTKSRRVQGYPWEEIETMYINGVKKFMDNGRVVHKYYTLKGLAEIYGCSLARINEKCAEGKWRIKKELLKKRRKQEFYREVYGVLSSESTKHDAETLGRLTKIEEIMNKQLELMEEKSDNEERVDARDLKNYIEMLEKSHAIARRLYGEPINLWEIEKEIENKRQKDREDKKIKAENAMGLLDTLIKRKERLERKKEKIINNEIIDVEVEESD